ncbi:complement C5 [Synchiropus splendidus]|uniref:complement C5 n=1 Tax=Synchiropus splendidus TaxID=270530 RepID=UPI00237E3B03|nr:complement C5 [Synchiropus splendidus]
MLEFPALASLESGEFRPKLHRCSRMKVWFLLLCIFGATWRSDARSRTYLITAPHLLRLDAVESVVVRLFGFSEDVQVFIFIKTSMALDHMVLSRDVVTLGQHNQHQAAARIRLLPSQLSPDVRHVILHVQSAEINQHVPLAVSRTNGFLFLQTDKPLYTPHQSVRVRAFSLNQELRPANRSVSLTFKDPDHQTVDVVQLIDANTGILSLEDPFKIPINPKLGMWSVEALYSGDFNTLARTDFEVKEYVLPSLAIRIEPDVHFISSSNFRRFSFRVTARYLHGAPVSNAGVVLHFGYVGDTAEPVIDPTSAMRQRLQSSGDLAMSVNIENLLQMNLDSLLEKHLYIGVLVQEDTGGISQESKLTSVKFVKSPYRLSLVSTSNFIKPGLSYGIQVLVKDHRDRPVSRVPVRLSQRQLFRASGGSEEMMCTSGSRSQSDGIAVFTCNTMADAIRATLEFETADQALPPDNQAHLSLKPVAYHSPNQRYLLIDPPIPGTLLVGQQAHIQVYWSMPVLVPVHDLGYLVLSRGTVVHFGTKEFVSSPDHKLTLSFPVTAAMVPSVRLLVYLMADAERTPELVTDSIWLRVQDKCVNGLQTELSIQQMDYKPKAVLQLDIRATQRGLVALSAVDTGLLSLRPNYKDPVSMILQHIDKSDMGCGGGGGRDAADVFQLAGLTFITNANSRPSTSDSGCKAATRRRRSPTPEQIKDKVMSFMNPDMQDCCEKGMEQVPKSTSCHGLAHKVTQHTLCRLVFQHCCEFYQGTLDQHLARLDEQYMDLASPPSLVRSYFPESWLWEVHQMRSGQLSITQTLPDSLTTWQVRAVGMFSTGMCVADPVQVSTRLDISVVVPLPYQVVRGEQLELQGSVYNQMGKTVRLRVVLSVGAAICLHGSQSVAGGAGLHASASDWHSVPEGGVARVSFTLLALEAGEHALTFTLQTHSGAADVIVKKLRVVPEGVKQEYFYGGRLDPQGVFGSEKRTVLLKNKVPAGMVPHTEVQRMLTIKGELLGDTLSILLDPEGVRQLVTLPGGSAEAELARLLPLVQVYRYLESTGSWGLLGSDITKNAADARRQIREGLVSISSFRRGDSSYSMWRRREGSTWLTAEVVRAMTAADPLVSVDHQTLSDSVAWLIRARQQVDGSFTEKSTYRPNRAMAEGAGPLERSVYLTSFVLVALIHSTRIRDPVLQLQFHDNSIRSAVNYVSQHAAGVRSVHVRAAATYALTLHDHNSVISSQLISSLETVARQKGSPPEYRYWQESGATAEWIQPDQSSALTVETTAYVLMAVLLKGMIPYAKPILNWLTQDHHYGEGFYSVQDSVITLEAISQYSRLVRHVDLDQDITVRYSRKGSLGQVQLTASRPVATPIQVTQDDDIQVMTGYGRGVSNVKMKTVFYQMALPSHNCHFDLTTDMTQVPGIAPHLVVCVRYKPPVNEVASSSGLTVMKIQLPTGVDPHLEDLREYRDYSSLRQTEPLLSHFELQGNTLTLQMESVPSANFSCFAFRFRTSFMVRGAREPLISVFEPQNKGSLCSSHFSLQQKKLQRLCVDGDCQCMTVSCATFRGKNHPQVTLEQRRTQTCRPSVKYAYRVKVSARRAEGDFEIFTASVSEVLRTHGEFEAVRPGAEVDLIKKVTCSSVDIQNHQQYLVTGSNGSKLQNQVGYRLVLDSEAVLEEWPEDSQSILDDLALDLQLDSCY